MPINDTNNTLKAGERGPSLLEDFLMREKITHFDHERIPERAPKSASSGSQFCPRPTAFQMKSRNSMAAQERWRRLFQTSAIVRVGFGLPNER